MPSMNPLNPGMKSNLPPPQRYGRGMVPYAPFGEKFADPINPTSAYEDVIWEPYRPSANGDFFIIGERTVIAKAAYLDDEVDEDLAFPLGMIVDKEV